jgi:hypothetical protein
MTKKNQGLALKPYLETIEKYCSQQTQPKLLEIILRIAQTIPQNERASFLQKITENEAEKVILVSYEGSLIDDIQKLRKEVDERISAIENGTYCEEYEAWDEYDEYDEIDYLSEEQKDDLEDLFQQTESLFLSNQLKAAKQAFDELFDFQLDDLDLNIDLREPRARYCRCIYEVVPSEERVEAVLNGIAPQESIRFNHYQRFSQCLSESKSPFLQDIIDAYLGELADFEEFLPKWEKALARLDSDRAALLRLEAIEFMQGLEGIAKQARKWAQKQPLGYLFWIQKLVNQQSWEEVASVSQEALSVLPHGEYRADIADSLTLAAESSNNSQLLCEGKKQKFFSLPDDNSLMAWLSEAEVQEKKTGALKDALDFLSKKNPLPKVLYAKTNLIAGKVDKAFELVKSDEKSYGWSSEHNPAGIVFASVLITLLPQNQEPSQGIRNFLQDYVIGRSFYRLDSEKTTSKISMTDQILQGIRHHKWSKSQQTSWLEWAKNNCKQRVEFIVGNKHREAYHRAAQVLCILGEYYILSGNETEGISLIKHYRNIQIEISNLITFQRLERNLTV